MRFLVAGFVAIAKRIDIVHPVGQGQVDPVAPRLFGKGRKPVCTGRKVPSVAVGARPYHVQHEIALVLFGQSAGVFGHGTTSDGLLGFFRCGEVAPKGIRVGLALLRAAKDAGIIPRNAGHLALVDGNHRREVGVDHFRCVVVHFLEGQTTKRNSKANLCV